MTPKEKAEELVNKFYKAHSGAYSSITASISKQCAIIAVDEILNEVPMVVDRIPNNRYMFWQSVKEELLKM